MDWLPPRVVGAVAAAAGFLAIAEEALAHAGGIRGAAPEPLSVPTWLFLVTGGGVVGASFLLASAVTDRTFLDRLDTWARPLPTPGGLGRWLARLVGLGGFAAVVAGGLVGPANPLFNTATLLVWVAWWGGFVAMTYLLGNAWPALDPFRTVARWLPSVDRPYPSSWGGWPAVAGLLALVYLEVVTPLASNPRLLAVVVAGYGLLTVGGAVVFGVDAWFENADPVARLLSYYGAVAPITWTAEGLQARLPGMGLTDAALVDGRDDVAFVVAALFATTFDGFVGTDLWVGVVRPVVEAGLPPLVAYLLAFLGGYGLFLGAFWGAARLARRTGATFVAGETLATRFTPSLLPIAAGYHLAHNLGTVIALAPVLGAVLAAPLAPPFVTPAPVPRWVGGVAIAAVLVGHLLAVWVAHATAYGLFPDRLQAVRSQYGITLVMIAYTMVSLWIVTSPGGTPPYV